jgi:hypothetical protein
MLPLGTLEMGRRKSRFTADEQRTLLTLWSIARSPLIMGGDLRSLDEPTLSLLSNDEVLAVNQASRDNGEVFKTDAACAWRARSASGAAVYVALFNLRDSPAAVAIGLGTLGIEGTARVRDLWQRVDLEPAREMLAPAIAAHGAGLFRLS